MYDEITYVICVMRMLRSYTIFMFCCTYMSAENKIIGGYNHVETYVAQNSVS